MRRRIGRVLLLTSGMLLVLALWFGWYAYKVYSGLSNITSQMVPTATDEPTVTIPNSINGHSRINILLLGSDNDRKSQEAHPLTQSMIVVSIDPVHYTVHMLSIPRDFWVPIGKYGFDKIDTASQKGAERGGFKAGIQMARETVEKVFHIPIHFYAWVGLSGFTKVIDTFGGITIDVKHPVLDDFYPNDITPQDPYGYRRVFIAPGWRHLSGSQALQYVRSRHGDAIGDFGRSDRQQQVLTQLRQKITFGNVLFNLPSLVDDLQGTVKTDLSLTQIYDLEQLSQKIHGSNIERWVLQAPVYCTYDFAQQNGLRVSILRPNWRVIRPLVKRIFAPIAAAAPAPPTHSTPTSVSTRPPAATATPRPSGTPMPASTPTATPQAIQDWNGQLPAAAVLVKNGQVVQLSRSGDIITLSPWPGAGMPAVAPDGRGVAYIQYRGFASDIQIVRRAGPHPDASPRLLTHNETKDVHNNLWAAWPAWSSDGRSILFSWDAQKLAIPESESRPLDLAIWSMPAAGGTPVRLTNPAIGAGGDTEPQWRGKSTQFLYDSWSYGANNAIDAQLVLQDINTGQTFPLTSPTARVLQAQMDASGSRVTYVRTVGGVDQLDVARIIDSPSPHLGPPTVLATGQVAQPAFTPGGKWVSFLRADGDSFSLYLERASGGTMYRVGAAGSDIDSTSRPVWVL